MSWILKDRRTRRSAERQTALRYQLEHTREQGGLEAVVVADDAGLILESAGDSAVCEELGAYAPLLVHSLMGMKLPPLLCGGDVAVRPISLNGQPVFLASIGGGVARDALLSHSELGVSRILASN
ncbi:MAG: hypothetical protein GXP55_10865 [Deltaproteobacteria bacterium]|nr:hypothetical protein [Deltaproteobacteria bacterium]